MKTNHDIISCFGTLTKTRIISAASFAKLAELCCFTPEADGAYECRSMIEHDLAAEQEIIKLIDRQASQAESLGHRATRYLYEQILLKTEERVYHLDHFLAADSLTLGFVHNGDKNIKFY